MVFVAFNTFFGLLTEARQQACFAAVAQRLAPGGAFVIEAFVPEPQPGSSVVVRSMTVDSLTLSVTTHDESAQTAQGQYVSLSEAGGVRMRPWAIRYATSSNSTRWRAAAGFRLAERWEDSHERRSAPTAHVTSPCIAQFTVPSAQTRMKRPKLRGAVSQLRLNPLTGRWVTIVAERAERPTDFAPASPRSKPIPIGRARSAPATKK